MSETPIVRDGTLADLLQIVDLLMPSLDTSIPGTTFSDAPVYTPGIVESRMRPRLFPPRTLKLYVLALPSTGEVVAYANVKPAPAEAQVYTSGFTLSADEQQDELDMFFVKAGMGGRGYGGLLLEAVQKDWVGRGGLQLHVFKKNARAVRFYERFGFRLVPGGEVEWPLELKEPRDETASLMSWKPSS